MPSKKTVAPTFPSPLFVRALLVLTVCFLFVAYKLFFSSSSNTLGLSTQSGFYRSLLMNPAEWSTEKSGTYEKVSTSTSGLTLIAGGNVAGTHYARLKYKLPETAGVIPTEFYMKATIDLPSDFFTKQKASLRVMNTDNFGTTFKGVKVGAANSDELRTAIYIDSTHHWRVLATHENHPTKTLWLSNSPIPTGKHVLEFSGSVAEVKPWYFKVDGNILASGTARLSPDSVPQKERVITRMIAGIDGAADQDYNSMTYTLNNFEIADRDITSGSISPTVAAPSISPAPSTKPAIDTTPPTLTVTSPVSGKLTSNAILFSVSAQDSSGIGLIEMWFDGKLFKSYPNLSTKNHTQTFSNLSSGPHYAMIVAYDKSPQKNVVKTIINLVK